MTQAVKRACDACHDRKVRCDGISSCKNCETAHLNCTYNSIPQKKGPKGTRAKVITALRERQRVTSLATTVRNRLQGIASPPATPPLLPTPGLLSADLIKDCLDFFFSHMYSHLPILDRRHIEQQSVFLDRRHIEQQSVFLDQNRDAYCLLASMCAFVMLQPGKGSLISSAPSSDPYDLDFFSISNITSSQVLVEEAIRVRKGFDYLEPTSNGCVTLNTLATDFFLFASAYATESHGKAWYHLRNASTLILISAMHYEDTYLKWDPLEASLRRRLYWIFFAAERAYALQRQKPLSLPATIKPPSVTDVPTVPLYSDIQNYLLRIFSFRIFDPGVVSAWSRLRATLSTSYNIAAMEKQLDEAFSLHSQDPLYIDLQVNREWLKSTLCHLCLKPDQTLLLFYLNTRGWVNTREWVLSMASQFPVSGIDLIGSGMIGKIFEACHAVINYLCVQPPPRYGFNTRRPRGSLFQILNIVAAVRNGLTQFLPLLLIELHDVIPRLVNPMLQDPPDVINSAQMTVQMRTDSTPYNTTFPGAQEVDDNFCSFTVR